MRGRTGRTIIGLQRDKRSKSRVTLRTASPQKKEHSPVPLGTIAGKVTDFKCVTRVL